MSTNPVYGASTIKPARRRKKRTRRTSAAMQVLRDNIYDDLSNDHPQTVRGVYYQIATTRQLLPKTDESYRVVQRLVLLMREEDIIPWNWITDSTRLMRKSASYDDLNDALDQATKYYRRALWNDQDAYVEIWCEKDATSGIIFDVTDRYDVPLMIARGQSSRTFLHESAQYLRRVGKPCFIYHLGDCDKYGKNAAWNIEKRLRQYAPDADITFMRLAVTDEQIEEWNLPTRPEKDGSGKLVTELDSIPAWRLRELVTWAIERHIDQDALETTKTIEAAERKTLIDFRQRWAA
jgi:hypothetical protein